MDVRDKLLTENPWKLMISLSLPAILGQLIVGLYMPLLIPFMLDRW